MPCATAHPEITEFLGEFETCPDWAPSLDGRATFARMPLIRKQLQRFERAAFHAANVRNVSRLGSQLFERLPLGPTVAGGYLSGNRATVSGMGR